MKPHMKVIQRNGVDIFVTSSLTMKKNKAPVNYVQECINAVNNGTFKVRKGGFKF
jgi:hypothetical protein